ncbi:L,D-transpeptidase family protein [Skermania sp. ID1734]|nr:L,D-transpeptidase family protein [Skermania sp. ID1734]
MSVILAFFAVVALIAGCGGDDQQGPAIQIPKTIAAPTLAVPAAGGPAWNPAAPVVVKADHGVLNQVTMVDTDSGKQINGDISPDKLTWTSKDPLTFGASYKVDAQAVNMALMSTSQSFTVNTISPDSTAYANVVPAPNLVADIGIGVGQPMVFQFTKPVVNKAEVQKHLKVTTTPNQPGAWYWTDDSNVHYRAAQYWQPGTKIHIEADVFGLDLGNGIFGAENNSADYTVHDSWVAKADGSTEVLTVFHNGEQVNSMPMSLGDPGHPSHEGPHVISAKNNSIVMDSCSYGVCKGQPGYYRETVYLDLRISNDGEFVHSAPWSVGQQGSSNVSHGCVNLSPGNAQWMFDHFNIGDVVEITNSGGGKLPIYDTYGDWEVPWDQWSAGNANG